MIIPPEYKLDQKIVCLLQEIEKSKTQLDLLPQNKVLEKRLRRKSILKSALFSARIEGIIKNPKDKNKTELDNLYRALEFVVKSPWQKDLEIKDIKKIHGLTLKGVSGDAGSLRTKPSAIFNQAGVAIYVCPMPGKIRGLMEEWVRFVNQDNESLIPVKAALAHFSFEKIHPFLDGNGRVGRLLVHLILKKWKYDLKGLVAFEQYLDDHRDRYYYLLNLKKRDVSLFVEFFLESLKTSLKETVGAREEIKEVVKEDLLPPRRHEILQIIKDRRQVSFNFIKRRFLMISDRLLRYDLKKLCDAGLIKKRGVTKGAVYEAIAV